MAPTSPTVVDCATRRAAAPRSARSCVEAKGRSALFLALGAAFFAVLSSAPLKAQSNNVRITKLSDVAFGAIGNLGADAVSSQSICIFANTATRGYQITASGSASGGSFALSSGSSLLDYEVQWNGAPSQSSGTQVSPNLTLSGLTSSATQQTCNAGPATSASLILILRSSVLSSARAGSYSGTLTLLVGPE